MKKLYEEVIEFGSDMNRHNASAYASSIAFFFFVAIFPSLMFLCSLIQFLPITESEFMGFILNLCPAGVEVTVSRIVGELYDISASVLPITAIATLWTAGMGIMGLIRGLNGLLEIEDKRNYFVLRGIATIYTFLLFTVVLVSLLLLGWGHSIYHKFVNVFPEARNIMSFILKFRVLFVVALLIVVFDLIYTFLPAQRQRLVLQLPGAIIAAIGWVFITRGFGIYIDYFHGFSVYGSVLTIIVILFWFYACFTLLIFGAFFNKYYNKQVNNRYSAFRQKRKDNKLERMAKKELKSTKNIDNI